MKKNSMTTQNNGSIHSHLRAISRVNIIIAIGALLVVGLLYAWFKWSLLPASQVTQNAVVESGNVEQRVGEDQELNESVSGADQDVLTVEYQNAVNNIFNEPIVFEPAQITTVLQSVLSLTVPVQFQDFHMELAIILTQANNGLVEDAAIAFDELVQEYKWFAPAK